MKIREMIGNAVANSIPMIIGETIGGIFADSVIGVVNSNLEYYINNPDGIETGYGYFIDHPEDTKRGKSNFLMFCRRVLVDHGVIKP